jgi:poly(ADP-ribose) glycohydrolase ARH3
VITEQKAKFLGAMVGSALGDAIGELSFSAPERQRLRALIEQSEKLVYTDDTAMALGLAESISKKRGIDQQDLGTTLACNFYREPWRGYASGPPTIFSMVRSHGISYVEAAKTLFGGLGSFGNGAAMRIVPVGLYFSNSQALYEAACDSAEVTHGHPVGKDGAAVLAWAVAQLVKLSPEEELPMDFFTRGLISFARTQEIQEKMKLVRTLIAENASPEASAGRLGRSVAVDESMPFAVYSFLRYPKSFENCLFCGVLNGGDCDTLGAMACGLSGAYLGIGRIPSEWRNKLENRVLIENLASALSENLAT